MPQASRSNMRAFGANVSSGLRDQLAGITIVEVLVAAVIVVTGVVGTLSAFNLVSSMLGKTSTTNAISNAIDDDIARIRYLSYAYTSCVNPVGSVPASGGCDVTPGKSNYYFPKSTDPVEIGKFFTACRSTTAASHITAGFVTAINSLSAVGSGVTRQTAARENGGDAANHVVVVKYAVGNSVVRVFKVAPIVSAWCG